MLNQVPDQILSLQLTSILNKKSPPLSRSGLAAMEINSGGVLLSHAVTHVVSSALQGLTTEFGMGSGVAPALWPPETLNSVASSQLPVTSFLEHSAFWSELTAES